MAGDGALLGAGKGGPANPLSVGEDAAAQAIPEAVQASPAGLAPQRVAAVHVGSADEALDPTAPYLTYLRCFPKVTVSSDVYAAWAGAGPLQPGTIVAVGTGSMALAVTVDGRQMRRGGWGYLLGDEGSAYSIGIAALRSAAAQWEQGLLDHPFLLQLLQHVQARSMEELWECVYREKMPRAEIAGLSRAVDQWAAQGSTPAKTILARAGEEIEGLAAAAVASSRERRVWYSGGVFRSNFARTSFLSKLRELQPGVETQAARLPAVLGAVLLAYEAVYPEALVDFCHNLLARLDEEGDLID